MIKKKIYKVKKMKPTDKMTIEELIEEKELLENKLTQILQKNNELNN